MSFAISNDFFVKICGFLLSKALSNRKVEELVYFRDFDVI